MKLGREWTPFVNGPAVGKEGGRTPYLVQVKMGSSPIKKKKWTVEVVMGSGFVEGGWEHSSFSSPEE
jgi:hypothetical protein